MNILSWVIVSVFILTITLFIHKNTYCDGEKVKIPMGIAILVGVIFCIPGINILLFTIGVIVYIALISTGGLYFYCKNIKSESIINFLTKDI